MLIGYESTNQNFSLFPLIFAEWHINISICCDICEKNVLRGFTLSMSK